MSKCQKCNKKSITDKYFEYEDPLCQEHEDLRVKAELKEKLKDIKNIYVVGLNKSSNSHWDRGLWNNFQCYYIKDNEPIRIWLYQADKSHWIKPKPDFKGGYFHNSVLGMDRVFDIVYGLGYWLFDDGYRFKEHFLSSL